MTMTHVEVPSHQRCSPAIALLTTILAVTACSLGADVEQAQGWARGCGLNDLKLFISSEDPRKIVISEPRIGGQPWGDPTALEMARLKRQSIVEPVVRCMEFKAEAAGVKIEYPIAMHY